MNTKVKPMSAPTLTGFRFKLTVNQPDVPTTARFAARRLTLKALLLIEGFWACPLHAGRAESEVKL